MTSSKTNSEFRAILDSLIEGILVVDNENKIKLFNSTFTEMWGIPQEIVEQRNDDILIKFVLNQLTEPEHFLKKVRFLYGSDLEDKDQLTFKDGKVFERNSFPLTNDTVKLGRIWTFREITREVKVNKEIRQYKNRLEDLVEKRTKDLKEASAKLAAYNSLTSDTLQLPLRSIEVYGAILHENYRSQLDDKGKNCIDRIRDSTQQMDLIVEELVNKSESKQTEITP